MTRFETRYYSIHPLDQLASNIEKYYNGLSDIFDELTVSKMRDIQNQIRAGKYTLSSLQLIVNKNEVPLKGFNHINHMLKNDSIFYSSLTPIQEEKLVLMALGGIRIINLRIIKELSIRLPLASN